MPRVIYCPGVWDLLHRGHLNMLWASKSRGDILVVGVVWDSGVFAYKGIYPVENLQQRMRRVRQLGFVDVVIDQRTTDPTSNLERFRPDALVHAGWDRLREGHDSLERLGVEFVNLPYTEGVSSTELRRQEAALRDPHAAVLIQRGESVT